MCRKGFCSGGQQAKRKKVGFMPCSLSLRYWIKSGLVCADCRLKPNENMNGTQACGRFLREEAPPPISGFVFCNRTGQQAPSGIPGVEQGQLCGDIAALAGGQFIGGVEVKRIVCITLQQQHVFKI